MFTCIALYGMRMPEERASYNMTKIIAYARIPIFYFTTLLGLNRNIFNVF